RNSAGWIAAILYALTPFSIFYGTDARPYSLVMLLLALGNWMLLKLNAQERVNKWNAIALIAIIWAGLWTHYFFIFPALFWTFYYLRSHWPIDQKQVGSLILTWLIPLVPVGILAGHQLSQLSNVNPLHAPMTLVSMAQFLYQGL